MFPGIAPMLAFEPKNNLSRHGPRLIAAASAAWSGTSLVGTPSEPVLLFNATQCPLWDECPDDCPDRDRWFVTRAVEQLNAKRVVVCDGRLVPAGGCSLHDYSRQRHWHPAPLGPLRFISMAAASYQTPSNDLSTFNLLAEAPRLEVGGVGYVEESLLPPSFHHRASCSVSCFPPARFINADGNTQHDGHYVRAMETGMARWLLSQPTPQEPMLVLEDALLYMGLSAVRDTPDLILHIPTGGANRYFHPCHTSDPFLAAFATLFLPITPDGRQVAGRLQWRAWKAWKGAQTVLDGLPMWLGPFDRSMAQLAATVYQELVLPLVNEWVRKEGSARGLGELDVEVLRASLFDVRVLYVILGGQRLLHSWSADNADLQRVLYGGSSTFDDTFPLHNLADLASGNVPPVSPIWTLSDTAYSFFLKSSTTTRLSWFEPNTGALLQHVPHPHLTP